MVLIDLDKLQKETVFAKNIEIIHYFGWWPSIHVIITPKNPSTLPTSLPSGEFAKVSAVNVKRTMRIGSQTFCAKKQRVDVRKADNAERDCHRKFNRMGFSLPIRIREAVHETETGTITTNYVSMTDYVEYFLRKAPFLLFGGNGDDAHDRLASFWRAFRSHHPQHEVYSTHGDALHKVIPYCFHGDEGKGPKRATFMDFSFETPFGLELSESSCSCSTELANDLPQDLALTMSHNAKGHSYLKRYLLFGLPHAWYKDGKDHIMEKHLELVSENARQFFHNGVSLPDGDVFYGAFIGLKGDLKFHKDVTVGLKRCYANMGSKNHLMMCSFCHAGLQRYPFEETDEVPQWSETMFVDRPWDVDPFVSSIPFDSQKPEFGLKLDPFHVMKVGFNRDVIGSIVFILLRLGYFDFTEEDSLAVPARLARAWGLFKLWTTVERKSPGCRSFTRSFFNAMTASNSPWVNAKGSDCTLMLKWLAFFLPLTLQTVPKAQEHKNLFKVMLQLTESILAFQNHCEKHGLFLRQECGQKLHGLVMTITRSYHWLARQALTLKIAGFSVKPKFHSLKHIAFQLRTELQSTDSDYCVNPQCYNCEGNEDHVGRVCKLGRNVSTRTIGRRVLQRYFLKTRALITRHKDTLEAKRSGKIT